MNDENKNYNKLIKNKNNKTHFIIDIHEETMSFPVEPWEMLNFKLIKAGGGDRQQHNIKSVCLSPQSDQ